MRQVKAGTQEREKERQNERCGAEHRVFQPKSKRTVRDTESEISVDRVRKEVTGNETVKDGAREKEKERLNERCGLEYVLGFVDLNVFQ